MRRVRYKTIIDDRDTFPKSRLGFLTIHMNNSLLYTVWNTRDTGCAQLRVRIWDRGSCRVVLCGLKQTTQSDNDGKRGNKKRERNLLTQNKLQSERGGCRVQWVAVGRRSVGAWSAWCRVGAALHLADSSMEKSLCRRLGCTSLRGLHMHTQTFNPGASGPVDPARRRRRRRQDP